jgi:plastocyanin
MASLPIAGLTLGTKPRGTKVFSVVLNDMDFGPVPADLRVGDIVAWVNDDIFDHTATAIDGSFDVDIKSGARVETKITKAGEIAFYCGYHPGMKGKLVARAGG